MRTSPPLRHVQRRHHHLSDVLDFAAQAVALLAVDRGRIGQTRFGGRRRGRGYAGGQKYRGDQHQTHKPCVVGHAEPPLKTDTEIN